MGLIICCGCGRQRNVEKIPRKLHVCSNCGARDPIVMRGKMNGLIDVSNKDGVDRETARHRTYAGLRRQAQFKGYKSGYVGVKFREIFGVWPNGETGTAAEPMTHELALWLRRDVSRFVLARRKIENNGSPQQAGPRQADWPDSDKPVSVAGRETTPAVRHGVIPPSGPHSSLMDDDDWDVKL